jgi:hypothetical protein
MPRDVQTLRQYRQIVGTAWNVLLRDVPRATGIKFSATKTMDAGDIRVLLGLLKYRTVEDHAAELPLICLRPAQSRPRTVVWVDKAGKSALFSANGSLSKPVQQLVDAGITVVGVDLLRQGEFLKVGQTVERQRWLEGEEGYAGWTYCYNLPLFARRTHDVLAVIRWLECEEPDCEIDLVGLEGAGHWTAAAAALASERLSRVAIDTDGFRFGHLRDVYHADFMPGAAKYHDLPGLLALTAPTRLWIAGEGAEIPMVVRRAYTAAGTRKQLTLASTPHNTVRQAITWLLDDGDLKSANGRIPHP